MVKLPYERHPVAEKLVKRLWGSQAPTPPPWGRHGDSSVPLQVCSPQSPAHSPDGGRTNFPPPTMRDRAPWRSVGVGFSSFATTFGIGMVHPALGAAVAVIVIALVLTIICTAMFGSPALSERAFRILRWISNRPEPPGPTSGHLSDGGKLWFRPLRHGRSLDNPMAQPRPRGHVGS